MKITRRRTRKQSQAVDRRVIQIAFSKGKSRDVDARVIGMLAVHRDCDVDESLGVNWCVTHVPTGCAVIGPNARATYKQAMKIMRECAVFAWDFGEFGIISDDVKASRVFNTSRGIIRAAGLRAGLKLKRLKKKPMPRRVRVRKEKSA